MHVKKLISYLIENAARYDPELTAPVRARVRRTIRRRGVNVYFIDLNDSSGRMLPLLVKLHTLTTVERNAYRVSPIPDRHSLAEFEGTALKQIQTFPPDSTFEPVKVYEVNAEKHLIVMERVDGEELANHVLAANIFKARTAPQNLVTWCERGGAVLKTFHENMPDQPGCELPDYKQLLNEVQLPQNFEHDIAKAFAGLNSDLKTGVLYGDFWPGNVLVRRSGKVAIIDPIAASSGPVYIDIAYFLVQLRMMKPQVYSYGLWHRTDVINACEGAFLKGYFGEQAIDRPSLNYLQTLILLCKWASNARMLKSRSPLRSAVKKIQLQWREPYYRKLMHRFLNAE